MFLKNLDNEKQIKNNINSKIYESRNIIEKLK